MRNILDTTAKIQCAKETGHYHQDSIAGVAKKQGISEQTIYTWRNRFAALQSDDVRRLKQHETGNARMKKLVAERDLEIEVMKEITANNTQAPMLLTYVRRTGWSPETHSPAMAQADQAIRLGCSPVAAGLLLFSPP